MNIRQLVRHLEEQVSHKDARAPNAEWILKELKSYIKNKDSESLIDGAFLKEELGKIQECEWCMMPLADDEVMVVVIPDMGRFRVCVDCLNQYANGHYEELTAKIKQVKG